MRMGNALEVPVIERWLIDSKRTVDPRASRGILLHTDADMHLGHSAGVVAVSSTSSLVSTTPLPLLGEVQHHT
jgi:hypothetical protein